MQHIKKFFILICIFSLITGASFRGGQLESQITLEGADTEFSVTVDPNIAIYGDDELNATSTAGTGTAGYPYIIENYVINASGFSVDGILINNTNAHFILRNCTINGADVGNSGIELRNVTKALLINNTAHNIEMWGMEGGFCLRSSNNNTLINNTAKNNFYGFSILSSHNNTLSNNTVRSKA